MEAKPLLLILDPRHVVPTSRYLFPALRRYWTVDVCDVPDGTERDVWGKLVSFRPSLSAWRDAMDRYYERRSKSAAKFRWRTRICDRELRKRGGAPDAVLQLSGMFAPSLTQTPCPYVVLISYTIRLAEREYPPWAPFRSPWASAEWFALERDLYHRAARVLTTNEHARRSITADYGVPPERTAAVGYGIPMDPLPEGLPAYDGKTVLFVGKDFERKGGLVLLDAFSRLRAQRPDARLMIVGPNPDRIRRPGLGVEWLGQVRDRAHLADLYRQAHVFVMPSLCDPFGLVFLEAMAHSLPCIGTTVDAMPEIIEDGKTGFLVPPGDPRSLADRISALLDDPDLARQMGMHGREKAVRTYSWDNMARNISRALRSVLAERRVTPHTFAMEIQHNPTKRLQADLSVEPGRGDSRS